TQGDGINAEDKFHCVHRVLCCCVSHVTITSLFQQRKSFMSALLKLLWGSGNFILPLTFSKCLRFQLSLMLYVCVCVCVFIYVCIHIFYVCVHKYKVYIYTNNVNKWWPSG
uniref:Uncharacterized protein n=1 Tax=Denticeps clupeoides TaxID=299321 RepID=A0AAY4BXX6_9TELE